MDRRPLGAPLPAHGRGDRLACASAVAAGARTSRRLIAALAGLLLVVAAGTAIVLLHRHHRPAARPPLLVGVDDDDLKWTPRPLAVVRRQRALGADAVRIWVPWRGEAWPGAVRRIELARAERAARKTNVVLAVFGAAWRSPHTAAARDRFCGYALGVLSLVPDARAIVVWNEANSRRYWHSGPTAYERLLARCYDILHELEPTITVLDSTSSSHAPAAFLEAVGHAYRTSGRNAPLVDAFGHNPYPRTSAEEPWATHPPGFLGEGDYARLTATLHDAFSGTAQRSLGVWYLEDGYQTTTPRGLARHYTGRENAITIGAPAQAQRLGEAIRLAACQPTVRAFFNFELVDESQLAGWQSGLFWLGRGRKPAATAFRTAARDVREGHTDCSSVLRLAAARP